MWFNNFIVFTLLWCQVLSHFADLEPFAPGKPHTWEEANHEIATKATGSTTAFGPSRRATEKTESIGEGHWDKSWWVGTSVTDFEWNKAQRALLEKATELGPRAANVHAFVGIKAKLEGTVFRYFWAAGSQEISLEDNPESRQTEILKEVTESDDFAMAQRGLVDERKRYSDLVRDTNQDYDKLIRERKRKYTSDAAGYSHDIEKMKKTPSKIEEHVLETLQETRDEDIEELGKQRMTEIKAIGLPPKLALGLVMYVTPATESAAGEANVHYKFIPIDKPFEPAGPSFFFVQDLRIKSVKKKKSPVIKTEPGSLEPGLHERGKLGAGGYSVPSMEAAERARIAKEKEERRRRTRKSKKTKKRSRSSKPYDKPISEQEKHGERMKASLAVEEPSPERYPLHYAHNDEYGYVNNTKQSKAPTMIILMITMCIMTVVCCGCAIIAAECYCVGKAHGRMNKETMEEEDAILRLHHIQNCI